MCEQIIKFCSGSTKPLLTIGSFLTMLLAVAIGYNGCSQHAIFKDIDESVAQEKSLLYHLQLLTAVYLFLMAVATTFVAHFDQKHSIRALTIISTINFVLAAVAILMVPPGAQLGSLFSEKLINATPIYNLTDKSLPSSTAEDLMLNSTYKVDNSNGLAQPGSFIKLTSNNNNGNSQSESNKPTPLITPVEATKIWDALQNRGCCGYQNATLEWKSGIPKSCCAEPTDENSKVICKEIDQQHTKSCLTLIESTSLNLVILLALVALVSLYLTTVFGVNSYRTFHYNEANQNAYT